MQKITLTAANAVALASLVTMTAKDKIPAQLTEIEITLTAGQITALSTDRFCAARYRCPGDGVDGSMRITAAGAKWIQTNVKPKNKHHTPAPVVFEYDTDTRAFWISQDGMSMSGNWDASKYPDLNTLFDGWTAADNAQPVNLRAEFVARLAKFVDAFKKVELWVFELGQDRIGRAERPGPVRARSGGFSVLVMPNLLHTPRTE